MGQLSGWIDRLPIHPALFYSLATLIVMLVSHAVRWLDGSLSPGRLDIARVVEAPIVVYFMALIHYLNVAARRALAIFRSALDVDDVEHRRLEQQLTTLPQTLSIAAALLGVGLAIASVRAGPLGWGLLPDSPLATRVYVFASAVIIIVTASVFVFHTLRQLSVVSRIHRMATRLSLFDRAPLYAFSALTLRTAMGLSLILYYYLFIAYVLHVFGREPISAVDASLIVVAVVVAAAAFCLPLLSMHGRLVEEKRRLVTDADRRYVAMVERFNEQIDRADLEQLEPLSKAISSLGIHREAVARLSTWPWRPDTFRTILTTVALPVVMLLVSSKLKRLLGL